MSTVEKNKKSSALGRVITRSRSNVVVVHQPPKPKTPPSDPKAKEEYEKFARRVESTLEIYKRQISVADAVAAFRKRYDEAKKLGEEGKWDKARDEVVTLEGDLSQLPLLVAAERDAETDCRAHLKELTKRIEEHQKLEPKKQDGTLLTFVNNELKKINKLMADKSFAGALKLIDNSDKKLREAKLRLTWGDGGSLGEDYKKKLPKMLRVAVEREEAVAMQDLKVRIQAENLGESLGPEVAAIMNEHRTALPGEVKSLKGYRWMDDAQTALDGARAKRDQGAIDGVVDDIKGIVESIKKARARQSRMVALLNRTVETPANKDALAEARQFSGTMVSHIPDVWLVEGERLEKRLPMMKQSNEERAKAKTEAMNVPDEVREEETALFKEVLEHGSLKGADRTQFYFDETLRAIERDTMDETALKKAKEAADLLEEYKKIDEDLRDDELISELSSKISTAEQTAKDAQTKLKKKGTQNSPDPEIAKALIASATASKEAIKTLREELDEAGVEPKTPESGSQYERLMKMFDKMIDRAYKIRDAGGSVAEVETSLAHVPPEFWPPQFTENLQAWRKVERELAQERVADIFANNDKFSFNDAKDCLGLAMETIGNLGLSSEMHGASTGANDTKGWMAAPEVAKLIEGYINQARNGFGNGEEAANALADLKFQGMSTDKLSNLYDSLAKSTSTFITAVTNIKNVPGIPEKSVFSAEVVPVLSAIAAGIDLTVALNALRKAITMRVKSGMMVDKAEVEYFSGKMRDGGALVKAIKNERDARKRQIGMKSVDVTSKGVIFSGEVTKAAVGSGWGTEQAVGYGLVIAGKAIEYGGKIVFAGIDWGIARQVKKLITEAQAGNPIARMELMENSGLYAKMYIAILAKEGHKLALVFVAQRGYDEQAVANPALSLKILREAMLAHADQKDETQVSDNLGVAITEGVTGKGVTKAVRLAGKGAVALAKKIKDLPKDKNIPYDPKWKPKTAASLSITEWQANKDDCIKKAGLYDESTGIQKALAPCDGEIKAADKTLDEYKNRTSGGKGDREKLIKLVRKTQETIQKAMDAIVDYYPGTNEGNFHEPMGDYLIDLRRVLGTQSNRLEQQLGDLGLVKIDWTAPKTPGTSAKDWDSNWADAAEECDLSEADGGVGEALHAYEKANGELTALKPEQLKEIRDKRIEVRDSLKEAGSAIKSLWSQCTGFPGVVEYLDQMVEYVLHTSQNNDNALNGFDWTDNPAKNFASDPTCFSSAKWKETYAAADKMGFCDRKVKDGGMEKALLAWEKHPLADDPDSVTAKDLTKKRKEAIKLLAEIAKDAEALAAANTDSHTEFLKYLAFMRRTAHSKVADLQKAQDETNFKVTFGLDSKSWEETYNAGVAVSAIPANEKAYKELNKVLGNYGKEVTTMLDARQGKKHKEAFAHALKAKALAATVESTASNVTGTEGWSNKRLNEFLDFVREQAQKEVETGEIAKILGGETAKFAKHTFTFVNKAWQDIKEEAVDAGLIADTKSGFGKLIDDYNKAKTKLDETAPKKTSKPQDYRKIYDLALKRLSMIHSVAKQLQANTKNANFIAYFKDAVTKCETAIADIKKNPPTV